MSLKQQPYYSVLCDFPGCGIEADYGEFSAYSDKSIAIEYALDSDWRQDRDGLRHYCDKHTMTWDVDIEDGYEVTPEPPYLLIHDSDGLVTLVLPEGQAQPEPWPWADLDESSKAGRLDKLIEELRAKDPWSLTNPRSILKYLGEEY